MGVSTLLEILGGSEALQSGTAYLIAVSTLLEILVYVFRRDAHRLEIGVRFNPS